MSLSLVATLDWRIAISQMALLLSGRSWYYPDIRQIDARQDIVVESMRQIIQDGVCFVFTFCRKSQQMTMEMYVKGLAISYEKLEVVSTMNVSG